MSRKILFIFSCLFSFCSLASVGHQHLQRANVDVKDKASMQRGAKLFMNYCSGCHSIKYMRYTQMAEGLDLMTFDGQLDKPLLLNNLVFSEVDVGEPIKVAMPAVDSREWFGKVPPDLSLVSRVRGADWLFTYLKSFYQDDTKPFHANNLVFPDVAMPNVLSPLQGVQLPVYAESVFEFEGKKRTEKVITNLQVVEEGSMTEHQFDAAVKDIVTFLSYVGEPVQVKRQHIGMWVLLFLFFMLGFVYAMKKAFWSQLKD